MSTFRRLAAPFLLLCLFSAAAHADEALIKKTLEAKFPGAKVEGVSKTPFTGLYEVFMEGHISYSDDKGRFLLTTGPNGMVMLDLVAQKNLTQDRLDTLTAIKFDSLPFDTAIKTVKGNGSRKLAVFADADCPYCKMLEQELSKVDNVTVYTFLYPLDSLHPDSGKKSKQIWCSPDRAKAWEEWMNKGSLPKNDGTCDNPVAKTVDLGRKLGIQATPTLFLANGHRLPGAAPAAKLEQMLGPVTAAK